MWVNSENRLPWRLSHSAQSLASRRSARSYDPSIRFALTPVEKPPTVWVSTWS